MFRDPAIDICKDTNGSLVKSLDNRIKIFKIAVIIEDLPQLRYEILSQPIEKFLIFTVQDWRFAIPVNSVIEIIAHTQPKKVPNTWDYVEGIIFYRETVCPILNLRKKFRIVNGQSPQFQQIIIVNNSYGIMGIISESVREIRGSDSEKLLYHEKLHDNEAYSCFTGGILYEDDYVGVLDLDKLLENPKAISINNIDMSAMRDPGFDPGS